MSRTRPVKRSREDTEMQFRNLSTKRKKLAGPVQPLRPRTLNPIAQQTIRVGGWANPSGGGELKFIDTSIGLNQITTDASWSTGSLVNGIAVGAGATERIGRKVTLKSLQIRWQFQMEPESFANIVGGSNGRILIVYDKQANAAAPLITDILRQNAYNANLNLNNRDRFVVLMDKITDCVSKEGNFSTSGKKFIRLNNESVFNSGTTADIGSIQTGSVYLFFANTGTTIFTDASALRFVADVRMRYTDV